MHFLIKPAFGLSLVVGLFAATTVALPAVEKDVSKQDLDVFDIMSAMPKDNHGIVSLGTDGVLRSICPNLTVLSYEKLNNNQIQKLVDSYGRDDNLSKAFEGVNGHDVVDQKQLTQGNKDFLPLAFPPDAPISKDRAIQARDNLVDAAVRCPATQCYGIGNCSPYCKSCFVAYPGYAGGCH